MTDYDNMTNEEKIQKAKALFMEQCDDMIDALTTVKETAEKLDDATFTEDTLVVIGGLRAVSTRSGELANIYGSAAAQAALEVIKEASHKRED